MRNRTIVLGLVAAGCVTAAAAVARADVVKLKDGTQLTGDVKKGGDGYVVYTTDGKSRYVDVEQVQSIELAKAGGTAAPDAADDRLASLRRSVDISADPHQAVARYQTFIKQNQGKPVAADAIRDLATWQERLDKKMVKVGGNWVTPQEADRLRGQSVILAGQARQLMKDGRNKEAESLLNQIMSVDAQNPSALYLRGVLLANQNQLPGARAAFQQVGSQLPDHAPTLNNLAVILFRQNQFGQAVYHYERALAANPQNRAVVDNVIEALNALPESDAKNPGAQRLRNRFTDAEARMQEAMAKQGLYRWGGRWVNEQEKARLEEEQKQYQAQLDQLSTQFAEVKNGAAEIDRQIADNDRKLRDLEASSFAYDAVTGRWVVVGYPLIYYELERDGTQLRRQRQQMLTKLDQLREAARVARDRMPNKPFSGVQRIIGEEGTPIAAADFAAAPTPPATQAR